MWKTVTGNLINIRRESKQGLKDHLQFGEHVSQYFRYYLFNFSYFVYLPGTSLYLVKYC